MCQALFNQHPELFSRKFSPSREGFDMPVQILFAPIPLRFLAAARSDTIMDLSVMPRLGAAQLRVVLRKHLKGPITAAHAQHPLTGMTDHASGFADQILGHRFDAPALGFVAHRQARLAQSVLANQAPQIKAFALARQVPGHTGVRSLFVSNGFYGHGTRAPLDDMNHRLLALMGRRCDGLHQLEGTKARIGAHQQRGGRHAGGHGHDALERVLDLAGRVLSARAQSQIQTIALGARVSDQRVIAINTCVGAPHQRFKGAAVVHGMGVNVQRPVATGQLSKVNWLAVDAATQKCGFQIGSRIKPVFSMGLHALTQRRARRRGLQCQRALEKRHRCKSDPCF